MKQVSDDTLMSLDERLLFVPVIEAFGGGERVYLAILRLLHRKGVPHRLVSYFHTIDLVSYADWDLPVQALNPSSNPLLKPFSLKKRLADSPHVTPVLVDLQAVLHAGFLGLDNYSVFILDTPSLLGQSNKSGLGRARQLFSYALIRRGLKRANRVLTNTNFLADEVEQLFGVRPAVLYPGAPGNPQDYTYRPPQKDHPFSLISVCRLENTKRIDWILRALSTLEQAAEPLSRRIDWRLDIVGTGSQHQALEAMAMQLGIAQRTVFHGHVSDGELERLYSGAHLFLMPAVQGYGLPALEALNHKMPVLMHRESGVSEVLNNSPWVEIFDGGEDNLVSGLDNILKRAISGELETQPLPVYPSETQWVEAVCRFFGWIG